MEKRTRIEAISKMVNRGWDFFLNLVYPEKCALCKQVLPSDNRGLCQACFENAGLILGDFCQKCGKVVEPDQSLCYDCSHHTHIFTRGHSLFAYEDIKAAVLDLKYHKARWRLLGLSRLMAWLYAEEVKEWGIEAITFVPQAYLDLGVKGYNPSAYMAKILAKEWGLPLVKNQVKARHKGKKQKYLGRAARQENLKNIYYCQGQVAFAKILLVDDIYTTGATIDACSACLKAKGADQVYFLTLGTGGFRQ